MDLAPIPEESSTDDTPKTVRRRPKKDTTTKDTAMPEKTSKRMIKKSKAPEIDVAAAAIGAESKAKPETKKLKKKLLDIVEVNETLTKALTDKNNEIADLKRSVQSLNEVLNSVPIDELRCNSSIASTKIVELSKKNRQLRAELETSKNRLSKKDVLMQKMERDYRLLTDKYKKLKESIDKKAKPAAASDETHTKITTLQQRVFEGRNKITELQTQLKLAQKCIQQEVGDQSINLNTLASGQSTWRGRAQQILHLQQRVHELKERLELLDRQGGGGGGGAGAGVIVGVSRLGGYGEMAATDATSGESPNDGMSSSYEQNTTTAAVTSTGVRRNELQHRAKVDKLEKEIAGLRGQLDEARQKILGLKVRNKTINDELLKYKMKACSLEEQTDYNGINLDRLNDELNAQKQTYEVRLQQMGRKLEAELRQQQEYAFRIEDLSNQNENLREVIKDKDIRIEEQEQAIESLQTDMKALVGDFLFSCRHFRREEFMAILDALEMEKNSLLELNRELQRRIDVERQKTDSLVEMAGRSKMRFSRLEVKIRDMEKDLEAQAERKKRSQRIAEYAQSISGSSVGTVGTFVFENSSLYKPKFDMENCIEYTELKHQLEFANEKIAMLQERNTNLIDEKQADFNQFETIMYNSKIMILNTIKNHKSPSVGYSMEELCYSPQTPMGDGPQSSVCS